MKKTLLCAIITAFAVYAFGQQHQAEKIERELKEHPQQDTFRVNRLVELFRLTMPTAGRLDTMANEALTISKKLNYDGGRVEGLRMLAVVYYRKNNLPQATLLLDQALAIAKTIKDQTYLSDAYASMASFSNLTGDQKHALAYSLKAEEAAQTTQNKILIAQRQNGISGLYANSIGDYTKSMEWAIKAEKNADEAGDLNAQALSWSNMAGIYTSIGDQSTSLIYYQKALDANKRLGNLSLEFNLLNRIGEMYRLSGRYQKALAAYKEGLSKTTLTYNTELTESNMADVYVRLGDLPMAFKYGFKSLHEAQSIDDAEGEEWIEGILARAYLKRNMPDSTIYYAQTGYSKSVKTGTIEYKRDNSKALADAYAMKKNYDDAYRYHLLFISYRDSMVNADVTNQASLLQYNYNLAKKQAQIVTLSQQKKMQYYFLAGSAGILLVVGSMGLILFRNNRQKQKANLLLSKQKREIETQRDQTNKALTELQITQNQLVQREKMASLGELTAGIAHEIQNPLNFVNNFAEVNIELLEELKEADAKGDKKEVSVLANDLAQNLEKIRQHGKRADGIVKGMLQHSRTSTGQKEPTDLNDLADEYLRLAYHGLRAKDKSFNAELVTHFDEKLPKVNVIPQDIGRVLLNIINNAFYATQQKAKTAGPDYKPTVEVSTFTPPSGGWGVSVKDNGSGIPDAVKDKIMQPFFTTKPTGEGTGLGLSLSYDIVVKGHGGKMEVDSVEGEYSAFIIKLPVN